MALCRFFQQGYCKNGTSCRFEHPGANTNSNPFGAPASNINRFNALNMAGNRPQEIPYKITRESIKSDLTVERPSWLLSSYGPGRDAPEQLFGGHPREQSLEEIMVYIKNAASQQQAESEVRALFQQAEQQNQTALSNIDGAIQFMLAAENKHPNRIDICNQNNSAAGIFARDPNGGPHSGFSNPLVSNAFSEPSKQTPFGGGGGGGPSFGQPSALGQKPNPFGSAQTTSTFGQPTAMGAAKPVFGQSTQMGGAAPAFGQPSALGQKPNPFGSAPSAHSVSSAPSAPSAFGQATQNPFGQPAASGQQPNPFSKPAQPSAPNPFGQPTPSTSSPFSQPITANPFAQTPSTPVNDQPMDTSAPSPAPGNPFKQASTTPFGVPTNNAFGAQQSGGFGAATSNIFAQPQTQTQPQQAPKPHPLAPLPTGNPYAPNSTKQHPAPESYISVAANGRKTFNGQLVHYKWLVDGKYQDQMPLDMGQTSPLVAGVRNSDGSWRKIFFPNGPPGYNKDTEPDPSMYTASIKAAYANMTAIGRFDGDMPEVPPMREDCIWNF
ncbi:hypothetical protein F4804DRAFT_217450 [Jackrogersella minutella]|nr:hypothetical protein F4804DRAFT_217450 [Jackrogersella minutella]